MNHYLQKITVFLLISLSTALLAQEEKLLQAQQTTQANSKQKLIQTEKKSDLKRGYKAYMDSESGKLVSKPDTKDSVISEGQIEYSEDNAVQIELKQDTKLQTSNVGLYGRKNAGQKL